MSRRTSWIVTLLLAPPACFLAHYLGASLANSHSAPPSAVAQSDLVVDPVHLDFGVVWATQRFDLRLPVTNRSEGEVVLVLAQPDSAVSHELKKIFLDLRANATQEPESGA
jgi:hypothetical protein